MKIFMGEIPSNPCEKCENWLPRIQVCTLSGCDNKVYYNAQLSILNQCVEVDIDRFYAAYQVYMCTQIRKGELIIPFDNFIQKQFIQEQIR
jgi:hypothetical protein